MSGDIGDRWTGQGQFVTDSGSTVMYSGSANAAGGVAVILNKQWGDSLLSYNPVSDRIMTVRVQASRWNLTLIQVYAPTNQATELEKDTFYQELEDVYEGCPKQGIVLVRGNFNAKIGERAPIGKYSMGVRNDNGDRLIQFAQVNGLCTANACVKRHPRRLSTWRSPDGAYRNQIDYFLVPQRWMSSVGKCRSYPSCDADTDHTLVGLKFGLKMKRCCRPHLAVRCDLSDRNERATF